MKFSKSLIKALSVSMIFSAASLTSMSLRASGVDLLLLHGTRYVALGGHQLGLGGDAYSLYYNPANMMSVKDPTVAMGSTNLLFQYEAPMGADNAQRKSEWGYGPYFFLGGVYPINDRVAVGLGMFPTASQGGKFTDINYGQFTAQEYSNLLIRFEIAPSVAVRLMENLSIGASWRIGYTRYDKFVGVTESSVNPAFNPVIPQTLDSSLSTWDVTGLKIGAYVDNVPGFTFGIAYRFPNPITMDGQTEWNVTSTLGSGGVPSGTYPTQQDITIPGQFQMGFAYDWIPDTFLTAFNYDFTQSSSLANDDPVINVGGIPVRSTTPLMYKDGHSFHFGAEYTMHLASTHKLRTGVGLAYDLPVTRDEYPNPVLSPSSDYLGYAIGANYDMGRHVVGAAFNWGKFTNESTSAELASGTLNSQVKKAYAGKYGLEIYTIGVDYQFRY